MKTRASLITIYKSLLTALLVATSAAVWADPAPLGLEMGKATVEELKQKIPAAESGTTSKMGGPFYTYLSDSPSSKIREVLFDFDETGMLVNATVFIAKDRWGSVLAGINLKYKRSKYVFRKREAIEGKVYLPPHIPLLPITAAGQYVFEDGDTIIYANSQRASLTYSTIASLPKLAAHVEKLRTDRLKAMTRDL